TPTQTPSQSSEDSASDGDNVAKDFRDITKRLSIACFYGGSSYNPQIDAIRNGIDILVGTPGRIKDHLQNNKLNLSKLKHVVLDEVDQMLDMGFTEQVEEILSSSYKKDSDTNPQTLLFSATCPSWVYDVAKKYMRPDCKHIDLIGKKTQKAATTVEDVESYIHRSGRTGRAGRTGVCICFYQRKEEDQLRYVENKAGITFRRVGVPTANDIIKSSSKDAARFLDSVPATAIEYFRESAEKLIEEKGAVDALAAALAHISGATSLEQRSLLNSDAVSVICTQKPIFTVGNIECFSK
ncbi:hypothetical protein XENOCAPTIV_026020, partial [Xenoophorus captivus]